jgi:predicted nucleic acid-binding protein
VLGVLVAAKRRGEIAAIKPEIQELRRKANFFLSEILEAEILAAVGESRY